MQIFLRVGFVSAAVATLLVFLGQGCVGRPNNSTNLAASSGTCATPAGFSGSPKTIEEAISMINSLPKPTSVGCFLQSLKRPFAINATSSAVSAQPAFSYRSPRIFILLDPLIISVVPEGAGSDVIEFSVVSPPSNSLKGELAFPVTTILTPTAAYEKVRFGSGTACVFCHQGELRAPEIAGEAFRSMALRPTGSSYVDFNDLKAEWLKCDATLEPKRCEILRGLFGGGNITPGEFPNSFPTLF